MNGREPFPDLVARPVEPGDVDAIVTTFRGLSRQSLYRRFFTLMPDPAPLVVRQLAMVDHRDHEAIVVLDGEHVVAVGQWDRSPRSHHEAELGITVEDGWQHRGLGRALTRLLAADARRHGVTRLTATVLTENQAALGLASQQGLAAVEVDGPETHLVFAMEPDAA